MSNVKAALISVTLVGTAVILLGLAVIRMEGQGRNFPPTSGSGSGLPANGLIGQSVCNTAAGTGTWCSAGIPLGNAGAAVTTTPYTVACDSATTVRDRLTLILLQSGASVVTVPQSSATGCGSSFTFQAQDDGAGTVTFNRTGSDTFSIADGTTNADAATSFTLTNGQYATLSNNSGTVWSVRKVQTTASPLSGMTAGQIPIAATATTVASSIPAPIIAVLTADWSCGTTGTVSSCVTAQIIGSGGGVPLTITLPLIAADWSWECYLVVSQATGATANTWSFQTATNGATNVTASYVTSTAAAGGGAAGSTTDTASTTSATAIGGTWTLGGTNNKMPTRIYGRIEGASASGTVLSLLLTGPTVADLVTIFRGSYCRVQP